MHVHLWRGSAPPLANLKAANLRATVYYFGLSSCLEPALKFSSLRSMADGRCVSASPNAARRTNKAAHMQTNEPMRCITGKSAAIYRAENRRKMAAVLPGSVPSPLASCEPVMGTTPFDESRDRANTESLKLTVCQVLSVYSYYTHIAHDIQAAAATFLAGADSPRDRFPRSQARAGRLYGPTRACAGTPVRAGARLCGPSRACAG